jgi:uncharacterized surface protein with fasciclin (FAS1) repeats
MKMQRITAALTLVAGLGIANYVTQNSARGQSGDLLTVAQANRSLSLFVMAMRSSGMAQMLRDDGPLTVFALSDRAFANLAKEDRDAILTNRVAMHVLLAHYIARGSIATNADLVSARTLLGTKLRIDIRDEGSYVNGAKLSQPGSTCTNGTIYILDFVDPGLIHDAIVLSGASRREK